MYQPVNPMGPMARCRWFEVPRPGAAHAATAANASVNNRTDSPPLRIVGHSAADADGGTLRRINARSNDAPWLLASSDANVASKI